MIPLPVADDVCCRYIPASDTLESWSCLVRGSNESVATAFRIDLSSPTIDQEVTVDATPTNHSSYSID